MSKITSQLFPKTQRFLAELGENIKLARLRRNITAKLQAERAGISIATLSKIEHGDPTVAIGNYAQVLSSLGLAGDFVKVAADDALGRKLQDLGLITKKRATSKSRNAGTQGKE